MLCKCVSSFWPNFDFFSPFSQTCCSIPTRSDHISLFTNTCSGAGASREHGLSIDCHWPCRCEPPVRKGVGSNPTVATPHVPWQSLFLRPAHRANARHCGDRPAAPVKSLRWAHRSPYRTAAGQKIMSSHLTGTSHHLAPRSSGPATTILAGQPTAASTSRADPEPSGAPTPPTKSATHKPRSGRHLDSSPRRAAAASSTPPAVTVHKTARGAAPCLLPSCGHQSDVHNLQHNSKLRCSAPSGSATARRSGATNGHAIKSRDAMNIATRHAFGAWCRLVLLLTVLTVGSPPSVGLLGGGRYVVKNFIHRAPGGGPLCFSVPLFP